MTIVLQHRFWDLIVSDDRFEVKLTFDGIPERLVVPFAAIKVFIDPSVRYGLQFDEEASDRELAASRHAVTADGAYDQFGEANADSPRTIPKSRAHPARRAAIRKYQTAQPSRTSIGPAQPSPPNPEPATRAGEPRTKDADAVTIEKEPAPESGAKILSLDQFRKK